MNLTPYEAEKLSLAWQAVQNAFYALEDIRFAGGFKEAIDPKYCKCCGKLKGTEEHEK